jgi:hypothetical protein
VPAGLAAGNAVTEGPWNPGLSSHVPLELRPLCTIFDTRNGFRLLHRHLEPELPAIRREYERVRLQLSEDRGRIYLRIRSGVPASVDRDALQTAIANADVRASLQVVAPGILRGEGPVTGIPEFLDGPDSEPTLGQWGTAVAQPGKSP